MFLDESEKIRGTLAGKVSVNSDLSEKLTILSSRWQTKRQKDGVLQISLRVLGQWSRGEATLVLFKILESSRSVQDNGSRQKPLFRFLMWTILFVCFLEQGRVVFL